MASLVLNSWTIALKKDSVSYSVGGTEDRSRMFDGTPKVMRSGHKRKWTFETTILDAKDAEGLIGVLQGKGDCFPFTGAWDGSGDFAGVLWSDKGNYPEGTPVATITPSVDQQTSPADVYDEAGGARETKFGDGSLWVGPSTTNLLSSDSADAESAPTGYTTTGGATLSAETTIILQGSKSLKVVGPNGSGFLTPNATGVTATGGNTYTGSVYVYATSAFSVRLRLYDGTSTTSTYVTTVANSWVRVEATKTIAGGATWIRLDMLNNDASSQTFYCDMLQVEEQDYGTPWVDGGVARAAPDLDYGDICSKSDSLTFAAWVRAPTSYFPSSYGTILYAGIVQGADTNGSAIWLRRNVDSSLNCYFRRDSAGYSNVSVANPFDGAWHHIAVVFSADNDGGTYIGLYVDGVLEDSETDHANYPKLRAPASTNVTYIGYTSDVTVFDGRVSEALIVPYPMSADQVLALAGRTSVLPQYPKLEALGDFNMASDYQPEIVQGLVTDVKYTGGIVSGTHKSYRRIVSFDLMSEEDI